MTTRKSRGMRTQNLVADYLAEHGWPHATPAGGGRPGVDVLGVPGLALEVKARADLAPLSWLRQATAHDAGLPLVVFRPNGLGEQPGQYVAFLRLADLVPLLHSGGFGTPPEEGI